MKKTIILSAAMAFATFGAFAQQANTAAPSQAKAAKIVGTVEERAKIQVDKLNGIAQLTPDQYTKVLDLTKTVITKKDQLRASGDQGDDRRAQLKSLRDQEESQLKAILTPEQFAKIQAARKSQEGHRPE